MRDYTVRRRLKCRRMWRLWWGRTELREKLRRSLSLALIRSLRWLRERERLRSIWSVMRREDKKWKNKVWIRKQNKNRFLKTKNSLKFQRSLINSFWIALKMTSLSSLRDLSFQLMVKYSQTTSKSSFSTLVTSQRRFPRLKFCYLRSCRSILIQKERIIFLFTIWRSFCVRFSTSKRSGWCKKNIKLKERRKAKDPKLTKKILECITREN